MTSTSPTSAGSSGPAGEFNCSRIVVWGNRIEHWLNGYLIVSATVGDAEWVRRIADSKFAKIEGFGRNPLGKIMLTDHGSEVWYRNIVLTPLPSPETVSYPGRTERLRCLFQRLRCRFRR